MSLIEKTLADELIEARQTKALGHDYVETTALIDALQRHLDREMEMRAAITALVDGGTA